MIKCELINPDIISALAFCGHGDRILIADGNYPLDSMTDGAELVYLGLRPGMPEVTDVLKTMLSVINVEKAQVMDPSDGTEPEIFSEFRSILGNMELEKIDRYGFYDSCKKEDVKLAISTGEKRTFANIIITVGVA